jgi:hypothetical protein
MAGSDEVLLRGGDVEETAPANAGVVPAALFGYGRSMWPAIAAADSSPAAAQWAGVALTALLLAALPFQPRILVAAGVDGSFDNAHNLTRGAPLGMETLALLMDATTGLSAAQVRALWIATGAAFGLLFALDLLSERWPEAVRWPASWCCENRQCYTEMFCEPTRASLVRRPGNTYSNVFYLFGALAVLLSTLSADCVARRSNAFRVADAMFGAMMLILALLSVTWHASNAPKSQYVDLWAMNSCIVYLIVRISE